MLSIPYIHSPQQIHFRSSGIRSQKLGIHALQLSYTHTYTHLLLHYLTPWILLSTLIGLDFTIILDNITLWFQKNFVQPCNVIVHFKNFQKKKKNSVLQCKASTVLHSPKILWIPCFKDPGLAVSTWRPEYVTPKLPLWHKDWFELKIIENPQRQREADSKFPLSD